MAGVRDFLLLAFSLTCLTLGGLYLAHQDSADFVAASPIFGVEIDEAPTPLAPTPTPVPNDSPIARLSIAAINVNAPIVKLGVDPDGVMQSPKGAKEVGWYEFSSHPSFAGNAVFAGHVDLATVGAAVFWDLRRVKIGDDVQVGLTDGTTYTYRITAIRSLVSGEAPIEEIIGPTQKQSITLITCDGTFNVRTHQYDRRLVVRAERV